jgi:maleate isomerase
MDDKTSLANRAAATAIPPAAQAGVAPWPDVQLGWRLRLGVLMPSVNNVAEPQMQKMLPRGVSMHMTRLKLKEASPEELLNSMTEKVEDGSLLLADANVQRILFHCTAVTVNDPGVVDRIKERITGPTGIPATATSESILAAFDRLGARKIVMVTPYMQAVNDNEVAYFEHYGVKVLNEHGLGMVGARDFETVEPTTWYRLTAERRDDNADAYFISCAQSRAAEVIEALEQDLDRPVVTSNTAAMWYCLRQSGINDYVPGFGTLFTL